MSDDRRVTLKTDGESNAVRWRVEEQEGYTPRLLTHRDTVGGTSSNQHDRREIKIIDWEHPGKKRCVRDVKVRGRECRRTCVRWRVTARFARQSDEKGDNCIKR